MRDEHSLRFAYALPPITAVILTLMYKCAYPSYIIYATFAIFFIWTAYETYYAIYVTKICQDMVCFIMFISLAFAINVSLFMLKYPSHLLTVTVSAVVYVALGILINFSSEIKDAILCKSKSKDAD